MKPHDPLEDLLRRRTPPSAPAGGPLCGDPELLAAYAENTLDAVARDQFQAHLAGCNACRESVAALVRMAPRPAVSPAPVGASNGWRWIWAAPALAVLALILVMTRPAPVPVAQPPVMTAKNEPPHPPPAVAPARDVPAPKLQRKPLPPSAPAPAVQAEADLKTLDRVEVTAAAPLAAAPVAPPPPPAQVTNAVIGGSFAGNSAAGNSAAGNSAAGKMRFPRAALTPTSRTTRAKTLFPSCRRARLRQFPHRRWRPGQQERPE